MKILFISTLNLATNPRFYKEIVLAKKNGFEVEVVCFEFNNWSYSFNKVLLDTIGDSKVHVIKGNRKPFFQWAVSVFTEKLYRFLGRYITLRGKILSQSVTRRSDLLIRCINKIKGRFDLVIGHNPGALLPAFYASQKFNCRSGFDVEDYHPGEGTNRNAHLQTKRLMNTYLPRMEFVTFAAPLMREKHMEDIGLKPQNWEVILNLFPGEQFEFSERQPDEPLQIVWFSQNVNFKRGLEDFIPALEHFGGEVMLTLIGNKKEPFYSEYVQGNPNIKYIEPMEQADLNRLICTYDVGLAIEPGKDHNNFLALSNKLITYFQAGLYVVATDTPAQRNFLKSHPHTGIILPGQDEMFIDRLSAIIASKSSIRSSKYDRFRYARQFNWENESRKLVELWDAVEP